jgi:plasmid stability protein
MTMAQLVVRHLEDEVKAGLRERAAKHGRSMEEEVRAILRAAVASEEEPVGLGSRIASYFAEVGFEDGIEELRSGPVRPASFEP